MRTLARKETSSRPPLAGASAHRPRSHPADPFLHLQRALGNRMLGSMLRPDARLTVSHPGDPDERQAERVATAVTGALTPPAAFGAHPAEARAPGLGRRAGGEGPQAVMRAGDVADRSQAITPEGEARVRALGGGQPLPGAVRSFFEPRFGADFGGVRIHTGADAAKAARSVDARAYTLGKDVAFGAGEYAPETAAGRRLIAHELTHTLQHPGNAPARRLQRTISVKDEGQTTPPHSQKNGAVVASLFNQLCPDITWQLVSGAVQPKAASDCDPKAVRKTTTPTACDCACGFTNPAGPHVEIVINPTDDDTISTGANSFRVRLTGRAATGIAGSRARRPPPARRSSRSPIPPS